MEHRGKALPRGTATSPESAMASELFDQFVSAATFKSVLATNRQLSDLLRLKPSTVVNYYPRLKSKLHSWRAASLWAKLDKRASHKCYNRGKACPNTRVLIIGAGPCGLRTAIEAQLLGAKVVVLEKRDRFSRNNVLHLWPFVIHDLRNLGAKKFFGKFCAGSIDHISIRQLQIILLKVALLLGVEVHENVGFESLLEPPEDQNHERIGWRATVSPPDHPVSQYEFDVLIGADGKRNTLLGFNRKEFRGKLAIAITANFINKHSLEEARVPEISGVAFIFNQKFFLDMREETAIDLENIVYYKDDTHYFVMTAKKQSLLERGVIIQDYNDTARLLAPENVDREALMDYARDAADFATSYQFPHLDFAVNHYGQADVAMFDFTSMYAAENACRVIQRREHKLLQGLVGDSLLEPFWPTGSGCARGFLSSFDAAWMIRSWALGKHTTLQALAERESIYRLLAQTTPENLSKDLNQYTLNPSSRYPNLNLQAVLPSQVRSLFNTDGQIEEHALEAVVELPKKKRRKESMIHPDTLLNWCQKQVALNNKIKIQDFTSSWKSGLALCSILHHYRPDLIDVAALDPENVAKNNQLAFDICERELGISPVMTGQEMAECAVPDKLTMVSYISQVYDSFRGEIPVLSRPKHEERTTSPSKQVHSTPLSILNKVSSRFQSKKKYSIEKDLKDKERGETVRKRTSLFNKRRSKDKTEKMNQDIILTDYKSLSPLKPRESIGTRVRNLEEQMKKDAGLRFRDVDETNKGTPTRSEQTELGIRMLQQQLRSNGEDSAKKSSNLKVGKLKKDEWNVKIIEEKSKQQQSRRSPNPEKSKIHKEIFESKLHHMDEKLKAGGTLTPEEEARYKRFDASLKKLETTLTKGSLSTGERGHNMTSAMTEHMSTIWDQKAGIKNPVVPDPIGRMVVDHEPSRITAASTVCYFCKDRVYVSEKLSAEGLFFHRSCFKCDYCSAVLRLGAYSFDREGLHGGKFYCTAHYRMQKTDLRQQEIMKRKQAFLTCALEKQTETLYQILRDNTEKKLSPQRPATQPASGTTAVDSPPKAGKAETHKSPNLLSADAATVTGRDQTPERVEYENTMLELSEDELLTSELEEEELTQKNFGPLHDLATSEDDYSDFSSEDSETDEEAFAEELERSLTADETRKLAETWNRKYSTEHSLIYSPSSSTDDESSDTEVGTDDTSHDIDSDAEYSIENSEEDGVQPSQGEASADNESSTTVKSEEDKAEFSMEVPVIDLKAINKDPKEETSSGSDSSEDSTDSDDSSVEGSGTEVETSSESESAPLPPQQIPTIVVFESPPQNTELDQEWVENTNQPKTSAQEKPDCTQIPVDDGIKDVTEPPYEVKEDVAIDLCIPSEQELENSSIEKPFKIDNAEDAITTKDATELLIQQKISPIEAAFGEVLDSVNADGKFISTDMGVNSSREKDIAPLAILETSSESSENISSLAKDLVSHTLRCAEDLVEHIVPGVPEGVTLQSPESVQEILVADKPQNLISEDSVASALRILKSNDDEIVHDMNSPFASSKSYKEFPTIEAGKTINDSSCMLPKKSEQKVENINETMLVENSVADSVLEEFFDSKSAQELEEECSFVTIRKKKAKNESYDWDSDKSFHAEDESSIFSSPTSNIEDRGSNTFHIFSSRDDPNKINEDQTRIIDSSTPIAVPKRTIFNFETPKLLKMTDFSLSQSLPNTSSSFLNKSPLPSDAEENKSLDQTSAKPDIVPITDDIMTKSYPGSETKEMNTSSSSSDMSKSAYGRIEENSADESKSNSAKSESKCKGYGGSFAEKMRPKSLFNDTIYLRSLNINLQEQPFLSLNKSEDKLDELLIEERDDTCKRRLFTEKSSPTESFLSESQNKFSTLPSAKHKYPSACLKQKAPVEQSTSSQTPNTRQKTGHAKHSSVSFSAPQSYSDLVSPYSCVQTKANEETNFPTKMRPKCDMDITRLKQKREKRKSLHEDILLPFADEEKIMSPIDPLVNILTPKKQDSDTSTTITESSYKTPDLVDEERYLKMQSTVEQEKAREEARARARLKSDEELGLSPNNYRKKYRRQLSLNSINYDELCSDEFMDQEEELEDDVINNFAIGTSSGVQDTFIMLKNTNLCPQNKIVDEPVIITSQPANEMSASTDTLDAEVDDNQTCSPPPDMAAPDQASSSETSPEFNYEHVESSFSSKMREKSKSRSSEGLVDEDKAKTNGKKSIFSLLNFSKGSSSKEKTKHKSKDASQPHPADSQSAQSTPKAKAFSTLKLTKSKEKTSKKTKSTPPENFPALPTDLQVETPNHSLAFHQANIIPKYTVYRTVEPTISTFPVHLPIPKLENGLAPQASEDSFSDDDDTSRTGNVPNTEKSEKNKELKAARIIQKVQRQQVLKRLRTAQEIQRRLEELDVQQKDVERHGVRLEKELRGEMRRQETESDLMQEWCSTIHKKHKLTREVQELLIRLKDLELEDRQSRLQQDFAQRMSEGTQKNATQLIEERKILDEMLKIVDKRNELVSVLEQLKIREEEEEKHIASDMMSKGMKTPISPES